MPNPIIFIQEFGQRNLDEFSKCILEKLNVYYFEKQVNFFYKLKIISNFQVKFEIENFE